MPCGSLARVLVSHVFENFVEKIPPFPDSLAERVHDGQGEDRLLADEVKKLVPVKDDEAGVVLRHRGRGRPRCRVAKRHFAEEVSLSHFRQGDFMARSRGGEPHFSRVDNVHLVSARVLFEDDVGFSEFPDEFFERRRIEHGIFPHVIEAGEQRKRVKRGKA